MNNSFMKRTSTIQALDLLEKYVNLYKLYTLKWSEYILAYDSMSKIS